MRSSGSLRAALVVETDTSGPLVTVRFLDTEASLSAVRLAHSYISPEGGFIGAIPNPGDLVAVAYIPNLREHVVVCHMAMAEVAGSPLQEEEVLPRNNLTSRTPLRGEGDVGLGADANSYLLFRGKTRDAVLGVDPLCRMIFFRETRHVQLLSQSFAVEGFFGVLEGFSHREPARDDRDQTPTGLRARIKTLAQHAPNIAMDFGAVLDEEELRLPGITPLASAQFGGGVVVRLMVHDLDAADAEATAGVVPADPRRARFGFRVDTAGNVLTQSEGQVTTLGEAIVSSALSRHVQIGGSVEVTADKTNLQMSAKGRAVLKARRGVRIESGGNIELDCKQLRLNGANFGVRLKGSLHWETESTLRLSALSHGEISVGGALVLSAGGIRHDTVGGRYQLSVLGSDAIENTGQDVVALGLSTGRGKIALNAETGSIELKVGPRAAPLAEIRIHHDLVRQAPYVGRIEIKTATGNQVVISPDGSWEIGSARSKVVCDAAGQIQLGPAAGQSGFVVTTASHLDYVTGLPLRGAPNVTVTQLLPGVPSPVAPPNPGALPPTLPVSLPDPPAFV